MVKDGQWLTTEEVEEYVGYQDRGMAPPDKFNDVVFDATQQNRAGYRRKTADEKSVEAEAEKVAKASVERRANLEKRLDREVLRLAPNEVVDSVTKAG